MGDASQYSEWPTEPHRRLVAAGYAFGRHLMAAARNYALERIPTTASAEGQDLAQKAALDAIYGMMMLLDGVAASPVGPDHAVEYALLARIRFKQTGKIVEQIELAPDGDGLCMGYHMWGAGDFGQ